MGRINSETVARLKNARKFKRKKSPWDFLSNDGNARAIGLMVVGIPALYAAATFVIQSAWPDPDEVIVVQAKEFLRGKGVNTTTPDPCYAGLLISEPPYINQANEVEYRVFIKREGRYSLLVEYAAADSRPVTIEANGKRFEGALEKVTAENHEHAGWCNDRTRWENIGVISVSRGANTISIKRDNAFPHLKTLKLIREA